MAKELELVRTTVLQLEEQLEKLKIDHEEALETQASYKEKINQLQAQLAQEVKHKNEITLVHSFSFVFRESRYLLVTPASSFSK